MQPNLNICQYTGVRLCNEYGVNARFSLLFKEVCNLKSTPYSLPIASSSILGGIKVGTNLSINASTGVLSATGTSYILPIASDTILGGIRVGSGLSIESSTGVLSTTGSGGGTTLVSITSANFESDGVTYLNSALGTNVSIFWNDINRFIYEADGEFQYVSGGIEITLAGFDANNFSYHLEIFIK